MPKLFEKRRILFTSIILICSLSIQHSQAQDSSTVNKLSSYIRNFPVFAEAYPQEKVYLHFDNTAYFLGETIWFKAYIVIAERNILTPLSKTLYVELLSPEGNIVKSKKFKIENGQCHGELDLKDSLYAGFYEVRAYTRCMLNFQKDYIYSRVFPVYNKPKVEGHYEVKEMHERPSSQAVPGNRKDYTQKNKLSVSFYPEGGNLVCGLKSNIAFKATDKKGEEAIINGSVYDSHGKEVVDLSSSFKSMGVFEFTPGQGKYTAKIQYKDNDYVFDLPAALTEGYAMTVDNTNKDTMLILVQKSQGMPKETLGLSISCRGRIYGSDLVKFDEQNELLFNIPEKLLPTGVNQITLFNRKGEILSERLVFVNHHSEMKMEVTQDKKNYNPFEKVNLDFQLDNSAGKPVETTFSVSVRDAETSSTNIFSDNILTNLLLSSEIKGYIENPGYYFDSDSPSKRAALDLLMLVQGWSRYSWKQMAGVEPVVIKNPIEKSLVIEGSVLSLFRKKKKENVDVSMILLSDHDATLGSCPTDKDGKFNLALPDFQGYRDLILQTKENNKRKENYILLDRGFSPDVKTYSYYERQQPENSKLENDTTVVPTEDSIVTSSTNKVSKDQMSQKDHLLKEVTVKDKKKYEREAEGMANASIVYNVEDVVDKCRDKGESTAALVLDFLADTNPFFSYSDSAIPDDTTPPVCRYKGKPVIFVLNNRLISETRKNIREILNSEVEYVAISEKENVYLQYVKDGDFSTKPVVIFIYTYKDGHRRFESIGTRKTKIEGYANVKEFFNPKYDNVVLPNEKDYRRTLYWNPDVTTDKNGKASISFFNNQTSRKINVSAETVTANGIIGVVDK